MAISFVFTLPEPNMGSANSLPFSRMVGDVICSLRNCMARICLFTDVRSPVTFSPAEFFPENVKTGMAPSLQLHCEFCKFSVLLVLAGGRLGSNTGCASARKAGATIDDFLQFVRIARSRQGNVQRDLLLQIQRCQRLIE